MKRSIVVTGASKGIGRAIADNLSADGWHVIGTARQAPSSFPGDFIACDLSDTSATERLATRLSSFSDLVGIVNNAGVVRHENFSDVDAEIFADLLDFNLRPALVLTKAILPNMRKSKFGRIVNITSLATKGLPFRTSYGASKAALESVTRTIALEYATEGVTSNAVAPGPTETELFRANNPTGGQGEARYLSQVPMRRFGTPSEIAAMVSFLCSDRAGFITGQTMYVDGGASLGSGIP